MSLILAKSHDDARAVIRLSKAGYGRQAAGLSRSLVESAINSRFIELDPKTHGKAFLKSIHESNRRLVRRLTPHASTDEMRNAIYSVGMMETESGWPSMLRDRANAIGKPMYLYDVVYLMLSQILHSDVTSLAASLSEEVPGQFKLQIGRRNDWVEQALATCFMGLYDIAWVGYRAFELGQSRIETLAEEFKRFSKLLGASRQGDEAESHSSR